MERKAIVVALVLVALAGAHAASSQGHARIEDLLAVRWSSVRYSKSVVVNNPQAIPSGASRNETSETLTLSCEIEIRDPNRVLGTSAEGTITQLTDGSGRDVDIGLPRGPRRAQYAGLRYRERFVPPPRVPKWQATIRSLLRIRPGTPPRPQRVSELQPNQLGLTLDLALLEGAGGEIRRLKGHFHALVADAIEHVDVPFAPSDNWIRLTPDQEIRVVEAQATGSSYRFRIEARPQGGFSRFDLSPGYRLPTRLVMSRQFLGADGDPIHGHFQFGPMLPPVAGSGSGSGGGGPVTKIRFLIAVDPRHQQVPFELEHIPLPEP